MAIQKTAKVDAEILKVKEKISEYQSRLKELESRKTGIENNEIVDIVRGMSIPLDELAALLQSINGGAFPAAASGQNVQKSKKAETTDTTEIKEEIE